MSKKKARITRRQIAEFRFSILGQLFSRPPKQGELAERLRELSGIDWTPPGSAYPEKYSVRTLERWYSAAKKSLIDPVAALLPAKRCDVGTRRVLSEEHCQWLKGNFREYPGWSWQLHADNLAATTLQPTPSYSTVLRWMRKQGFFPTRKSLRVRSIKEIRSFESAFSGELWHLDGHVCSRKVLNENGEYETARCIAFIDDRSRLCCHCQWVKGESAEEVVHIFIQAILKRGLPRRVMSDNGSGMIAAEFEEGVRKLGMTHERTLPKSPHQNGKIESFWKPMEHRLVAMLGNIRPLTIDKLNIYTQAWVEQEYNISVHSETHQKPKERFFSETSVIRQPPAYEIIRRSFRTIETRKQRRTDGTVSLEGVRFEIPQRFRHIERLSLAYSRWNMSLATIVNPDSHEEISDIYPIDKETNAVLNRQQIPEEKGDTRDENDNNACLNSLPPLLERYVEQQKQDNLHCGYIPLERK